MFRVLLVDDEELALISLQYSFPWKEYGFTELVTTTDSGEALRLLEERQMDAAFVDIRMPGLNGLELLKLAQERGLDTVFVIVSGYSDFAYAKTAIGYGVLDYCLKPVSEEEAPGLLGRLQRRILSLCYNRDPQYAIRLLSDEDCCRSLLALLAPEGEDRQVLTLLHIHSAKLLTLFPEIVAFSPYEALFWGEQDVLLLWGAGPHEELLLEFLEKYQSTALLILERSQPEPAAFQSALKRVRMEREGSEEGRCGLVQFSPISDELQSCFYSLLSYVDEHYDQSLTLQSLAQRFGIGYTYLSGQFHRATGKSFPEYLTAVRLQEACRLLTGTQLKVGDIAEKVGYGDCHYFNNVFKRQLGTTPLQYRKAARKEPEV